MIDILFAQDVNGSESIYSSLFILVPTLLILYFIIVRPQNKERAAYEKMIEELKVGDKVITKGGILGKIVSFMGKNNSKVTLDLGSNVKINILKSYIQGHNKKEIE